MSGGWRMKSRKRAYSGRTDQRFLPTPRDRRILEAVRVHGRLTSQQIRRLFFRQTDQLATLQAVNARLRRLVDRRYLEVLIVDRGRGSGPYAYGLGPAGHALLHRLASGRRAFSSKAVWHLLEVGEFRVELELSLSRQGGELVEWVGEGTLRGILAGRKGWPIPDALVHWRHRRREGVLLLEWDRGSESLPLLTRRLERYAAYGRARGHRELLPGLGLKPRLVVVVSSGDRARRLVEWLGSRQGLPYTVAVGLAAEVTQQPLATVWWRSDLNRMTHLLEE